ncbi:putative type II restriction enzyme methylase subunit [Lactococcus lactis subsp. lactis]|uniref:BREX-1 system adenine-specific DNA-methyltransferase PglX n=1 Tax=Lactococcus lactis TaxID=1358 RepID=UPI00071CAA0B|nr:BREX-1 system adenine-specific DNA-methyltransferase PglX [Lactococcus lactis]KST91108.1 putative type II restriction enzyme methylase subunit [Lactococcus lactis subsp. lactis]
MNKNAIQKYAVWARTELISQVNQQAYFYGIDENGYGEENPVAVNERVLTDNEKSQRRELVSKIKQSSYQQVMEEVAYTWFNRFVALRYMEVNDYLPTHIRVFSDINGKFKPEILDNALRLELDGLDSSKVATFINDNATNELYNYLLLTQCNALNSALPEMFERLDSYTELLLPANLLKDDSVLGRLVSDIPEADWQDAVQIIGWLYQYYNTEPKQEVFDGLKKNKKITKEKIPAATQLFTPDWIVRYMVENSLGRTWLEAHPDSPLKSEWRYYLEEAEQLPEVAAELAQIRSTRSGLSPEDITFLDPCMGSGHILVYAFDVLIQIYESAGYRPREAAKLILEKNLFGLDIDKRAYQLAYFALMMKARQYNRRILTLDVKPQVYHPEGWADGEEFGSLVKVERLEPKPVEQIDQLDLEDYDTQLRVWNFKRLLSQKYDVVVTNPPYMGARGMNEVLVDYTKENYPKSKSDLFAIFIERCSKYLKANGFQSMITQHTWMFLSRYENLREELMNQDIINMVHLGARAFDEISGDVVQTVAFVMSKKSLSNYYATYSRLVNYSGEEEKKEAFLSGKNLYSFKKENFRKIDGIPFTAYHLADKVFDTFSGKESLGNLAEIVSGMTTGDNNKYLRLWHELRIDKISFNEKDISNVDLTTTNWFPYNKGGELRKWYGNNEWVVNWGQSKNFNRAKTTMTHLYLKECVTWSDISGTDFAGRYCPGGFMFDVKGSCGFGNQENLYYLIGTLNSKLTPIFVEIFNPSTTTQVGDLKRIPLIYGKSKSEIENLVKESISISKLDWDSFEVSWEFEKHPLILANDRISSSFDFWKQATEKRFNMLKDNEEKLNEIFIDIYGLQSELTPEVEEDTLKIRKADLVRDVKSLISYAVGCIFGRYTPYEDGLFYAGGTWNYGSKVERIMDSAKRNGVENWIDPFLPDEDNIIPITDDEYFEDDIVGRFVEFISKIYGEATLEENLKFIADALGGKGTPRQVLRNYFLKDFYKDHVKMYQKRPIYWMFDSGKKNGFKALVYLHRYSRDTLAKLRTDYIHEQQDRYHTQLEQIEQELLTAEGRERVALTKAQTKFMAQVQETVVFEEKVHHLADMSIELDLDDGVKVNYPKFGDILAKVF